MEIGNKKRKGFVTFGIMGDVDTGIQNVGSYMRNLLNVDLGENVTEGDVCFIIPREPIFIQVKDSNR